MKTSINLMLVIAVVVYNSLTVFANNENASGELIKKFVQFVDEENWNGLVELYSSVEKEDTARFLGNVENVNGNIGYFSIEEFELVSYCKIDDEDLQRFSNIEKYKELFYGDKQFVGYRIMVDVKCKEESPYFYDGLNYFLIVLVNETDGWKIAEFSNAPPLLINYKSKHSTEKKVKSYTAEEEAKAKYIVDERNKGIFLNGNGDIIEINQASPIDILIKNGYRIKQINNKRLMVLFHSIINK